MSQQKQNVDRTAACRAASIASRTGAGISYESDERSAYSTRATSIGIGCDRTGKHCVLKC